MDKTKRKAEAPAQQPSAGSPLLQLLRSMDKDQRLAFAEACNTTEVYLYQLAAKKEPNPTLRLAKAIHENSWALAKQLKRLGLEYDDLLVGDPEGK